MKIIKYFADLFGNIFFIRAIFAHAIKQRFSFFHQQTIAANGTGFFCRHIPNGEITFRIFGTTEKYGMIFAETFDNGCAAFRTRNTDFLADALFIFTFRKIAASIKFAETSFANDDVAATEFTFQVGFFRFFFFFFHMT